MLVGCQRSCFLRPAAQVMGLWGHRSTVPQRIWGGHSLPFLPGAQEAQGTGCGRSCWCCCHVLMGRTDWGGGGGGMGQSRSLGPDAHKPRSSLQASEALGHFPSTEDIIFLFVFQEGQIVIEIHLIKPRCITPSWDECISGMIVPISPFLPCLLQGSLCSLLTMASFPSSFRLFFPPLSLVLISLLSRILVWFTHLGYIGSSLRMGTCSHFSFQYPNHLPHSEYTADIPELSVTWMNDWKQWFSTGMSPGGSKAVHFLLSEYSQPWYPYLFAIFKQRILFSFYRALCMLCEDPH